MGSERAEPPTREGTLLRKWSALWGLPGLEGGISLSFSPRLQRGLGRCAPERGAITLNGALRSAAPRRLAEVLCHEAAHVAAFVLYGRSVRPHGAEWAELVSRAGFSPSARAPGLGPARSAHLPVGDRRLTYEHRCDVCQSVRLARRSVPRWRCSECVAAGLAGKLTITRRSGAFERA